MKNYALHLLRMVLLPSSTISVLEIDAFGLLLGLFCTLPSLSEPSFDSDVRGVPQFNPILVNNDSAHVYLFFFFFSYFSRVLITMMNRLNLFFFSGLAHFPSLSILSCDANRGYNGARIRRYGYGSAVV